MTVLTYTASDEPVVKTFNGSGVDISIASADNSFNSVTTDLSGMLAEEWIFVSGAAAADGNNWHQLDVDSTRSEERRVGKGCIARWSPGE